MSYEPTLGGDIGGPVANTLVNKISGPSPIPITPSLLMWAATTVAPTLGQTTNAAAANGQTTVIAAQDTSTAGFNGGALALRAGSGGGGGGHQGDIILQYGTAVTQELGRFVFTPYAGFLSGLNWNFSTTIRPVQNPSNAQGLSLTLGGGQGGAGNNNGGTLHLYSGAPTGTGLKGDIAVDLNGGAAADRMLEMTELVSGQRIMSLVKGATLTTGMMPANTGDRVMYVGDAATVPTASPTAGTILYSSGGALFIWQSNGTNFQISPSAAVTWATDSRRFDQHLAGRGLALHRERDPPHRDHRARVRREPGRDRQAQVRERADHHGRAQRGQYS